MDRLKRMITFDPNKEGYAPPLWATYCPGRRPSWKAHHDRGRALSAADFHRYAFVLYFWNSEAQRWVEVDRRNPGKPHCTRCGIEMSKPARGGWIAIPCLRYMTLCMNCAAEFGRVGIWRMPVDKRWMP